jgi:hypothetical protein
VEELGEPLAQRAAMLRRRAGRGSAVDALVVAFAEPGGTVLTSDLEGLEALAEYAQRVKLEFRSWPGRTAVTHPRSGRDFEQELW